MFRAWRSRLLEYYRVHATRVEIAFFLGGVAFDIVTLNEIDNFWSLLQQALYLVLCFGILHWDLKYPPQATPPRGLAWAWPYRDLALHFMLGSVLSLYSIFFFLSSASLSSAFVVLALIALMVANELPWVRSAGPSVRTILFWIALICFVSIVWPILLGILGWTTFALTVLTLTAIAYAHDRNLIRAGRASRRRAVAGTLSAFIALYGLGWIPPVPLSASGMAVYHALEKREGKYILSHERPWWKFWSRGDAHFRAEPGDKVFFFTKVFSPTRFSDAVKVVWTHEDSKGGRRRTDEIEMKISGGRAEGYRGYTVKQNLSPGLWTVSVQTTDGRTIGATRFEFEPVPASGTPREFKSDVF